MKNLLRAVFGIASALSLGAAAQAQITPGHMQSLLISKNLTVVGNDRSPDGSVDAIAVTDASGWPFVFSLVDFDGNSTKDAVLMLTFVPNRTSPPEFINFVNQNAASKAFLPDGHSAFSFVQLGIGTLDQRMLNAAWDIFQAEWISFRQQVLQQSQGGNYLGVSLADADPEVIDAGLTRTEVTARDAALTAALNQGLGHVGAESVVQVSMPGETLPTIAKLMELATEAAEQQKNKF